MGRWTSSVLSWRFSDVGDGMAPVYIGGGEVGDRNGQSLKREDTLFIGETRVSAIKSADRQRFTPEFACTQFSSHLIQRILVEYKMYWIQLEIYKIFDFLKNIWNFKKIKKGNSEENRKIRPFRSAFPLYSKRNHWSWMSITP